MSPDEAVQALQNPAPAAQPMGNPAEVVNALQQPAPAKNLLQQAQDQYPVLKNYDYGYKYSEGRAPFMLEHWEPGMSTSIPGVDRPKEFGADQHGIEVFDPKTTPMDVTGDIVSHHLRNVDPTIKGTYDGFQKSLEPWQHDILKEQYAHAQKSYGEDQPYDKWAQDSGIPAYFRGLPFQQWPGREDMYTPDQVTKLNGMMNYLRTGKQ